MTRKMDPELEKDEKCEKNFSFVERYTTKLVKKRNKNVKKY